MEYTRNTKIMMEKDGLQTPTEKNPSLKPMTYRELSVKYNLSITRLLFIIQRERRKYGRIQ
jgi:Mor family transcriptional regulator